MNKNKRTVRITVYKFDGLSKEAQERVISDEIDLETVEEMGEDSPYYYLWEEMERLQTPWFLGQEIYKKHKQDIIKSIIERDNEYYANGKLYWKS